MKTFFTKLGSLLLCGVAFAMVGCTDFSEDIQAVDQKVDKVQTNLSATDVKVENLQSALDALSAKLAADYATKAELNKVSEDLNKVIADQVAGLDAKIGKVGEDLAAAVKGVNAAIAELEAADAANEAAIEAAKAEAKAAVATLAAALEAEKAAVEAEIEAINAQIAETNEAIAAVDAKAEENHNTLESLSVYLETLEAKVNELKATLDSLSEYLPTVEAKIASNTAKIDELKNTLESLALHLTEKEAEVDAKLNELHNTLASLSVYMEALEASIDARFAEILNTIESLSLHLATVEAQVALNTESAAAANAKAEELFNTILSLSEELAAEKAANAAKFNEVLNTFESLSIYLAKLEAEHAAGIADNSAKIAELKNELVSLSAHLEETEADYAAKFTEIQNTFLSLSEHLNAEEAANAAKFAEILATFESLSQHLSAEEAENDAKFAELQNTLLSLSEYLEVEGKKVEELKNELVSLSAHLAEKDAENNAKFLELQNTLFSLSIFLEEADLVNRVSALEDEVEAQKAAAEVFEALMLARTEQLFGQLEALSPEFATVKAQVAELKNELLSLSVHLGERDAEVDAKIAELKNELLSLSEQLPEMLKPLQDQINELFNTILSLSGKIDELDAKDAELDAKITELKNELLSLSLYLPTVEEKIANNEDAIAELNEKVTTADAKANELKGQIDALAEVLPGMLEDVRASFAGLTDQLINDLNGLIQSLVFVPEYAGEGAQLYAYEFFGGALNNQVIVRATYQVTPQALVSRIGHDLQVVAALQPVKTRAAADAYVWAKEVIVTNTNESTGKFDVDIIFDATEFASPYVQQRGGYALALYVQHPAYVMADSDEETSVDDSMGILPVEPQEAIVKNCISSEFVALSENNGYEITENYVIAAYNENQKKYVEYKNAEEMIQWSEKENARTPFAGHQIMFRHENNIISLAEAAKLFRVEEASITPLFQDRFVLVDANGAPETVADCKAQTITPATPVVDGKLVARTFAINGVPTVKNAGDYVGHRVTNDADLYFEVEGLTGTVEKTVKSYSYSYEIDYRTANLVLEGVEGAHELAWDLPTAIALTTPGKEATTPYDRAIDEKLDPKFSEYQLPEGKDAPDFDYEKVINGLTPTTAVYKNGSKNPMTGSDVPEIVITPKTSLLHNVAKVSVTNYKAGFNGGATYKFVQTYFAEDLYTKVNFEYTLKLGAMPAKVNVAVDHEFDYSINTHVHKFALDTLVSSNSTPDFKKYLSEDMVNNYYPKNDQVNNPYNVTVLTAGEDVIKTGSGVFDYKTGKAAVATENMDKIRKAGEGAIKSTVKTWYGVEFNYIINLTINEPAYMLETIPAYVTEDNKAYLNYQIKTDPETKAAHFAIEDADIAHYIKVKAKDDANSVKVKLTILKAEDGTRPTFANGNVSRTVGGNINADGTFKPGEYKVVWGNYKHLTAQVQAQLIVNEAPFLDPIVITLVAPDPISDIVANNDKAVKVRNADMNPTSFDVLSAIDVHLLAYEKTISASAFATNNTKYAERKSSTYNATFETAGDIEVYYLDSKGDKVIYSPELYDVNEDGQHINVVLKPESAILQTNIYATVPVKVIYDLNGDVDYATTTEKVTTVTVTFTPPTK